MESLTLPLFDRATAVTGAVRAPALVNAGDPDGLRPYQREAVVGILSKLCVEGFRSTLIVMATGTGKTQTFGSVAKHWPGRVLILAHRDELIEQARGRMARMTGEFVDVEKAERRASGARLVVGSVQTMCKLSRLKRFSPDDFGLIIIDEAHHAPARTYRRILEYFTAKVLGVTATPDRGDALAMEMVFQSVAYTYTIEDGVRDRYLKPVERFAVATGAIDLSAVKTVSGDFNQGQLDAVMSSEPALHAVVKPTIDEAGDRRTIVFTTSIDNARRMAEIFNRYRPGAARSVDSTTASDIRTATLEGHKRGDYQYLVNVGILTEGYDDPGVSCVALGRPTKSRSLVAQMIGRGLRPEDGQRVKDGEKCLVLEFKGTSRHSLSISVLDVLAGRWPTDVVERAKKEATKSGGGRRSTDDELKAAAAAIKAEKEAEALKRAGITARKVEYHKTQVDPFRVMGLSGDADEESSGISQPATPAQVDQLTKFGMEITPNLTRARASKLIGAAIMRRSKNLSSYKQMRLLDRYGVNGRSMYFTTASRVIDAIAKNKWQALSPDALASVCNKRESGEDG